MSGEVIFHLPPSDDFAEATVTALLNTQDLLLATGSSVKMVRKSGEVLPLVVFGEPVTGFSPVPSHPSQFLVNTGSRLFFCDTQGGIKWKLQLPRKYPEQDKKEEK